MMDRNSRETVPETVPDKEERCPYLYVIILFFVMAFFVQNNLIWLLQDTLPPSWDQTGHVLLSLRYARSIKDFFSISHYYPPLFHLTAVPVILLFGFAEDNLIMTNFLYMFLFLVSIYGIGKLLFNRRVGVLAAVLCLFYPIMYALSREFLLDFALVAIVTCVQYLILVSEGGLKKPWNILLGIAAGAALLIKLVALVFFLPLWAYVLIRRLKQTKTFSPLTTCLLITLTLVLPWYFFAFKDMLTLNSYWQNLATTIYHHPNKFLPSFLWYAYALKNPLMSPNLFNFFFIGLSLFLMIGRKWKDLLIFACWVVPAFFIFIVTPNKNSRYIMSILPALSLLTVAGIDTVRIKAIRNILYFVVIAIGYIQFNNLSFGIFPDLIKDKNPYDSHPPLKQDWKNREVIHYLSERFPNKEILIGVLPDCPYFNPAELQLYAYLLRLPYSVKGVGESAVNLEDIKRYDIFITKYPQIAAEWVAFYREKLYKELSEKGIETLGFSKLTEFALPDDSTAVLYENQKSYGK